MGKGGYLGGSTLVVQGSGWFGAPNPKVERQHAVGKAEGEAALERKRQRERAAQENLLKANERLATGLARRGVKVQKNLEKLAAEAKDAAPPEAGSKALKSAAQTEARMRKVEVLTKPQPRMIKKPTP